jgi:hypothetical protein
MRTLLHSPAEHAAAAAAAAAAPAATHLHAPTRHGTLEGHVLPGVMFIVWVRVAPWLRGGAVARTPPCRL